MRSANPEEERYSKRCTPSERMETAVPYPARLPDLACPLKRYPACYPAGLPGLPLGAKYLIPW